MLTFVPVLERLQTVDHGTIVTVRGRRKDDEHKADVGPS